MRGAGEGLARVAHALLPPSRRGQVLVEGAADQAAKKLTTMNLHEKIGAGVPKDSKTSSTELAGMGITEEYIERLTELHFSTFRQVGRPRRACAGGRGDLRFPRGGANVLPRTGCTVAERARPGPFTARPRCRSQGLSGRQARGQGRRGRGVCAQPLAGAARGARLHGGQAD